MNASIHKHQHEEKVYAMFVTVCATLDLFSLVVTDLIQAKRGHAVRQEDNGAQTVVIRKLSVVFAPHLPSKFCEYIIDSTGVRGLKR